jgi:hypothetical protein
MKPLFALAIVLCSAVACRSGGEDRNQSDKHSDRAEKMAQSLRAKIQDEIKTIGNHEWAGQYYHG